MHILRCMRSRVGFVRRPGPSGANWRDDSTGLGGTICKGERVFGSVLRAHLFVKGRKCCLDDSGIALEGLGLEDGGRGREKESRGEGGSCRLVAYHILTVRILHNALPRAF